MNFVYSHVRLHDRRLWRRTYSTHARRLVFISLEFVNSYVYISCLLLWYFCCFCFRLFFSSSRRCSFFLNTHLFIIAVRTCISTVARTHFLPYLDFHAQAHTPSADLYGGSLSLCFRFDIWVLWLCAISKPYGLVFVLVDSVCNVLRLVWSRADLSIQSAWIMRSIDNVWSNWFVHTHCSSRCLLFLFV